MKVTESSKSQNEVPRDTSIPEDGDSLESILCTEELQRCPSRPPDYEQENGALVKLTSELADSPSTILYALEPLRHDDESTLYRGDLRYSGTPFVLLLMPVSPRPTLGSLEKLEHECSLRGELDATWAVRPLALSQYNDQRVLVLEDPGGEPLNRLIQGPMEMEQFLRIAISLAAALNQLHKRELIHKDVKPGNVLVNSATGDVRLMGFGIASRLLRERQSPEPPEFIAGTLPYMAPEQTGRMNRSIDSRSDLYAFGVTLYEMLIGSLPFTASDPMEWVHCHIARQPVPPHERLKNVPGPVSAIIMKLLAKTPEERYQTAAGADSDLRRCLAEWEGDSRSHRRIRSRKTRYAGPAADSREIVRARTRDRHSAQRLRPRRSRPQAGVGAGFWILRDRQISDNNHA